MAKEYKSKRVDGVYARTHTFDDGNKVVNISFKAEEFIEWINANTNSKGYASISLYELDEPTEKGLTHRVVEDSYRNSQ